MKIRELLVDETFVMVMVVVFIATFGIPMVIKIGHLIGD